MNISRQINNCIEKIPLGEPFTSIEMLKYGSRANVDQILSRLVKAKKLTRVARGVFVKTEKTPYLNIGTILPEPSKIASSVVRSTGEVIAPHGAEAARQLQLSTQVPTKPIFLTNGSTRHIKAGNIEIVLKHTSYRKIANAGTILGLVISALWYLGKKRVNVHVIEHLQKKLTPKQFQSVQKNTSSMPGWMADIFYHYHKEHGRAHI
jgi:hypothetical protein